MLTNPNTLGLFDPNIEEIAADRARGRRDAVLRRRQPQRGDGPLAARRHGLRHRPLQPAQVLHPAPRRRRPGLGPDRRLRAHRARSCRGRWSSRGARTATFDARPRRRAPRKSIGRLRGFQGNYGCFVRSYAYICSLGARRPEGRLGDGRAERQLPARAAAASTASPSTCRSPTASCACTSSCSPAGR